MKGLNFKGITKSALRFGTRIKTGTNRHLPEILTAVGIGGFIGTVVLAVKATPKAQEEIIKKKEELAADKLTKVETVKATWKCYAPVVVLGAASTACIVGGCRTSLKRNAALVTAYKVAERATREYKESVESVITPEQKEEITKRAMEQSASTGITARETAIVTGHGNELFYDPASGRHFLSSRNYIDSCVNKLNADIINTMDPTCSLSRLYDELNIPRTSTSDILGWNSTRLINVDYNGYLFDDGTPGIEIEYWNGPVPDYDMW